MTFVSTTTVYLLHPERKEAIAMHLDVAPETERLVREEARRAQLEKAIEDPAWLPDRILSITPIR